MFDKRKCIDEFGLTEELWQELFGEFMDQTAKRLADFDAAFARGDAREIGELAHGLKGVAGNLRVDDIRDAAIGIMAAAGTADMAAIARGIETVRRLHAELSVHR